MTPFEPTGFGLDIFKSRHAAHSDESWQAACSRVAGTVANAETGAGRGQWKTVFEEQLVSNRFMPGGRIWYGAGRPRGQLLNCFVIPTSDSREGWGKTLYDSLVISGTGGGVGLNCSPIRPRGSSIAGTGGVATGAVSLMEAVDAVGEVVKAGGGRRTALMLCLGLGHPDILEFLDKKLDLGKLNNANVSVVFDGDPEAFLGAVANNAQWALSFQSRPHGSVPAAQLWDKIVENALRGGEPGILNGYLANKMSNIWYLEPLTSTNPCGEIWMSPYDCCCLGALVLPRFVTKGDDEPWVLWDELRNSINVAVRFLDNVLTVNNYPLPEIAAKCAQLRRIGLGVTGLHDMLLMLGFRYSSDEGMEFVHRLMRFIKNESYAASARLAEEKGSFPEFRAGPFLKSGFVKGLRPTLRTLIAQKGMRNCAVNTIAPTGTISIVCGTSSGIEPIFAPLYERRFRKGDEIAKETVMHPLYEQFTASGWDTSHFEGAHELSIRTHLEMQAVCQEHVDNAVSKTINVPQGTPAEELSELLIEYLPRLKGVTVYPDGSREDQPLTPLPTPDCRSGVCEL